MHVLLTGASSGIGAALARAFSEDGHALTLVARRAERLSALSEELGPTQVLARDLLDPAAVEGLVDAAERGLGPVDVLVNNAGMELLAASHSLDPAQAERLLRLNLLVPLQLHRQVLPTMRERRSGCIVDVASVAAFASQPFATHYCASKAGLAAAGRQLRWELKGTGVHALTVYPGPIHTEMGQRALSAYTTDPSGGWLPWGTAEELSQRILRAISRRQGELVYPSIYRVARWVPALTTLITQQTRARLKD